MKMKPLARLFTVALLCFCMLFIAIVAQAAWAKAFDCTREEFVKKYVEVSNISDRLSDLLLELNEKAPSEYRRVYEWSPNNYLRLRMTTEDTTDKVCVLTISFDSLNSSISNMEVAREEFVSVLERSLLSVGIKDVDANSVLFEHMNFDWGNENANTGKTIGNVYYKLIVEDGVITISYSLDELYLTEKAFLKHRGKTVHVDDFIVRFDAMIEHFTGGKADDFYMKGTGDAFNLGVFKSMVYIGTSWSVRCVYSEDGYVNNVNGYIRMKSNAYPFYEAVVYALSKNEIGSPDQFNNSQQKENASNINYWVNGFERILSFEETKDSSLMKFDFRSDIIRQTRHLPIGTYTVGKEGLYSGEYIATTFSKNDSSLRIYRNRKLVFSSLLNRNSDTDSMILFDGDIIEVKLETAVMKLVE